MKERKPQIITVHLAEGAGDDLLAGPICEFYADVIERRLIHSGLPPRQQTAVLEQLLARFSQPE